MMEVIKTRWILTLVGIVLTLLWLSVNIFHILSIYQEPDASENFARQNSVFLTDQERQEFKTQVEDLKKHIEELESLKFKKETSESEISHLMHRRNTRYWLESKHVWPKDPIPATDKYVTFSPWYGGFNNIRMSLEIAVAAAFAFNRTLVLPPSYKMYLRGKAGLEDYFELEDLKRAIPVVTYAEFMERVPEFKRLQQTERVGGNERHATKYFSALSKMSDVSIHNETFWRHKKIISMNVLYCDPRCSTKSDDKREYEWFLKYKKHARETFNVQSDLISKPRIIHFPANLLGHFYSSFWFKDPQRNRRLKRIIRDHLHFKEEIFTMAERVVEKLGDFNFSCLHVRRNEFQFDDARTPAQGIADNIRGLIKPGEQIYIATDELSAGEKKNFDPEAMTKKRKHSWFAPIVSEYGEENVHFLDEYFEPLLRKDIPKIWIGNVESVICTRARVFIGTRKSTFSGYINRMRGYMQDVGQTMILDAQTKYPEEYYKQFISPSWAALPRGAFGASHPYWGREYREAWEGVWDPIS